MSTVEPHFTHSSASTAMSLLIDSTTTTSATVETTAIDPSTPGSSSALLSFTEQTLSSSQSPVSTGSWESDGGSSGGNNSSSISATKQSLPVRVIVGITVSIAATAVFLLLIGFVLLHRRRIRAQARILAHDPRTITPERRWPRLFAILEWHSFQKSRSRRESTRATVHSGEAEVGNVIRETMQNDSSRAELERLVAGLQRWLVLNSRSSSNIMTSNPFADPASNDMSRHPSADRSLVHISEAMSQVQNAFRVSQVNEMTNHSPGPASDSNLYTEWNEGPHSLEQGETSLSRNSTVASVTPPPSYHTTST